MSGFFKVVRPRAFRGSEPVFHSRQRRYGTDPGQWDGIIVLSPAWNLRREKRGGGNSAKPCAGHDLNPGTDTEKRAENQPGDTDCRERRLEDVPRFAATDRRARLAVVEACGTTASAASPDSAAIPGAAGTPFPRRRAAAVFRRRLGATDRPVTGPDTSKATKHSGCDAAERRPGPDRRSARNRHAAGDWNKTPADRAPTGRWSGPDRCLEENCAGSAFQFSRSGDSAAA
jgi:hypothetical protein